MWTSKKARGQTKEATTVSSRPLMFSNTLSDVNIVSESPISPERGPITCSDYAPLDSSIIPSDDNTLPAYQDDYNNTARPQKTKRTITGDSLRSTASTIWYKTRDSVTQFNVPRIAAPWEHELTEKDELNGVPTTARNFDYRRQRRRLFINGSFQWGITAAICVALVAVLYSYSHRLTLTQVEKHAFNALVTGLSILLGLSLASSFSGYAQMMRWRLLAAKYRNLQDFELILNCDSQMKVVRLLWAGRTQGRWWWPNKTQLLAFTWLSINTALQVFTALLGLTYSVDTSSSWVRNQWGNVSIADLSMIYDPGTTASTNVVNQAGIAWTYGIQGENYPWEVDIPADDQIWPQTVYTDNTYSKFWYRFQDQSPLDSTESEVTDRTVTFTASCNEYKVLSGGYATDDEYVTFFDTVIQENYTLWVPLSATGSSTWMGNTAKTCGPRCTTVFMLLSADNFTDSVPYPKFFSCNNTVGQVTNAEEYQEPAKYQLPDEQARLWAGAIGFSGISYDDDDLEYVLYEHASAWSPNTYTGGVNEDQVAALLMAFTTGALAAEDANGPRVNVTGWYPIQAQVVDVQWEWAIALLAGIPGCQLLVLAAVLIWANKVIIKDTSHLATARLLRPVVDKLGEKGCLLTGDEIADVLGNYRLKYGVRDPPQSSTAYGGLGEDFVKHVDVIEESEGLGRADARMVNGLYDGTDTWKVDDSEREPLLKKRRARRLSI